MLRGNNSGGIVRSNTTSRPRATSNSRPIYKGGNLIRSRFSKAGRPVSQTCSVIAEEETSPGTRANAVCSCWVRTVDDEYMRMGSCLEPYDPDGNCQPGSSCCGQIVNDDWSNTC